MSHTLSKKHEIQRAAQNIHQEINFNKSNH
jgi:hypothetical protein